MVTGFIVSCASFNSPYRGRVISSVDDPDFQSTEKNGYLYIKTTYKLSDPQFGIHEVRIPTNLNFKHHSSKKMFKEIGYSYSLDGNDFSCYKGYDSSKALIPRTEYRKESSYWGSNEIKCFNSSHVENSKVSITFKVKKSQKVDIESLEKGSMTWADIHDQTPEFQTIYYNHIRYLKNPSLYSDHEKVHQVAGDQEVTHIKADTYGYQFSKKLKEGESIFINAPAGTVYFHKIGEVGTQGHTTKRIKKNFLDQNQKAYALICRITHQTGEVSISNFKYQSSRISLKNQELIECGINQPNKEKRLKKNSGKIELNYSVLSPEIVSRNLSAIKKGPQDYFDKLVNDTNAYNIEIIRKSFNNTNEVYNKIIQNEKDISSIAPANLSINTKVKRNTFTFKPYKEKVFHEGTGLYYIDYIISLSESHRSKNSYSYYGKELKKATAIEIEAPEKYRIRTNIKFEESEKNQILSNLYLFISHYDKDSYIKKIKELSKKTYIEASELKELLDFKRYDYISAQPADKKITIQRSSLEVCAKATPYEKELPRGSVLKTKLTFDTVLSSYNHKDQSYKSEKIMKAKRIDSVSFKTNRNYSRVKNQVSCFPISSKDLAERNFRQFTTK